MPPPVPRSASAPAPAPGPARAPDALRAQLLYPPPAFHFAVTFGSNAKDRDGAFREVTGLGTQECLLHLRAGI